MTQRSNRRLEFAQPCIEINQDVVCRLEEPIEFGTAGEAVGSRRVVGDCCAAELYRAVETAAGE